MAKKRDFTLSKEQKITLRTETINRYFSDISKIDKLTQEEEIALIERIQSGDETAKTVLISSNLRFVVSIAKTFAHNEQLLEELISEGNIGLIKAANKFDSSKNVRFISYAVWWIRREIMYFMNQTNRHIRIPANQVDSINSVKRILDSVEQEICRTPTLDDLSDILSPDELESAKIVLSMDNMDVVHFESPISVDRDNGEERNLYDILTSDDMSTDSLMNKKDRVNLVVKALSILTDNEKRVISKRYGLMGEPDGMTYDEISTTLGMPISTVRKHEGKGMDKIRYRLRNSLTYSE